MSSLPAELKSVHMKEAISQPMPINFINSNEDLQKNLDYGKEHSISKYR
jgi:hypothetical protein